ncbi:HEAT repeat domain-containing protein [Listeria fleischmannii]|uniref:PBS lyase n=1 Tax=Listeria fleischmannii FSL S10-1203 TaxID=1265822 RepID=W7DHD0_9LIST|nr:HEAT repeat domain-containing protein [Listeria fleischmannii]EUJ50916.1 PBS lyase [Listeria fleischmannii FSL S10-1203]
MWHFSGKDVRTAALKHLQDSDTIVQIDCIEILNNYDDIEVIEALKCKLDDRDELVRCFAAESLADKKSSKTLAFLFEKVKTEKSELVTTGLYYAIYTQGEAQVLEKLLHQLESYNHRVIIRTLLMLETISDKKNYPIILEAIQNLASKPGVPISVFEKADSIMDNLTNTFNIK